MIEKGRISKLLDQNLAEVVLYGNSCNGCQGCLTAQVACAECKIIAQNLNKRQVGDEVEISAPSAVICKAFFLVFLLPIIVLVAAIAIFQVLNFGTELNLFISFLLFLSTYFWANKYDKELAQKQIYKIL